MKKIIALLLVAVMCLSFVACSGESDNTETPSGGGNIENNGGSTNESDSNDLDLCQEWREIASGGTIKFDEEGKVLEKKTESLIGEKCRIKNQKYVFGGFYGSDTFDKIKLFERGGSDVTGAWIASALNAEIYENWTDVSGFFVCDPRIVPNPRKIDCMSYQQLKILSTLGAGVLHHKSVYPTKRKNIPINIKSIYKPQENGTYILPFNKQSGDVIGITATEAYRIDCLQGEVNFEIFDKNSLLFYCSNCGFLTAVIKKKENNEKKIANLSFSSGISFKNEITLISLLVDGKEKKSFQLSQALKKEGFDCQILCDDFGLAMCATNPQKKEEAISAIYKYFL